VKAAQGQQAFCPLCMHEDFITDLQSVPAPPGRAWDWDSSI
jgi:hypothetical protein